MPPLEIGENWIGEVWGEWIGPCNNSGGTVTVIVTVTVTVTAGTQLIYECLDSCT